MHAFPAYINVTFTFKYPNGFRSTITFGIYLILICRNFLAGSSEMFSSGPWVSHTHIIYISSPTTGASELWYIVTGNSQVYVFNLCLIMNASVDESWEGNANQLTNTKYSGTLIVHLLHHFFYHCTTASNSDSKSFISGNAIVMMMWHEC